MSPSVDRHSCLACTWLLLSLGLPRGIEPFLLRHSPPGRSPSNLLQDNEDRWMQRRSEWYLPPSSERRSSSGGSPKVVVVGGREVHQRVVVGDCDDATPEVRDLCERCAKFTRSEKVFPMCCGLDDPEQLDLPPVLDWCREFMDYGLKVDKRRTLPPESGTRLLQRLLYGLQRSN